MVNCSEALESDHAQYSDKYFLTCILYKEHSL